jgi:iron-sulfur cluster insertion protein
MNILTLTDNAKKQIDSLCEKNNKWAVTLNMKGGGCAGFEYTWGFLNNEDEMEEDDEWVNTDNYRLVVGNPSLMYLMGTTIDYKEEVFGSHFSLDNPNAKSSCGCGTSISV